MGLGLLNVLTADGSTIVALAPGIRATPDALVDDDGRRFPVDRAGSEVAALLGTPVEVRAAARAFAGRHDIDPSVATEGLLAFLTALDRGSLLSVNASFTREVVARTASLPYRIAAALAIAPPSAAPYAAVRRYRPDARGLARAIVDAHQPVAWLGVVVIAVAAGIALALAPTPQIAALGVRTAVLFGAGYTLLVLVNVVVHEASHLAMARACRAPLHGVYARVGVAGVSVGATTARRRLAIALAGPLAALALDLAVVLVLVFGSDGFWAAASVDQLRLSTVLAAAVLAVFQLACLSPVTSDGRQIRRALRELSGREVPHA